MENRLTEVLATVLDAHHPLSAELFACRGLDPGVRVRWFTQEWLAQGCLPDMKARSENGRGAPLADLWVENKRQSAFRPGQMEDYRDALGDLCGSNGLIALVMNASKAPQSDGTTMRASSESRRWPISSRKATRWRDRPTASPPSP